MARFLREEGRKLFTMSALFDREGICYAVAEDISIIVDLPEELVPRSIA